MHQPQWGKACVFALVIIVLSVSAWEIWLRNHHNPLSYDDGKELWADKRAMVYEPQDKATVFIGSSRNKYDLDLTIWTKLTGDHPIQLAMEGSNPLPVLDDLAKDQKFKGKLIIDVTEGLFFSLAPGNKGGPQERIEYYHKRTPAQKFSFLVNRELESRLVFLDKESYSLNAMLDKLHVPNRKGVFQMPIFPREFGIVTFDRQNYMTPEFVADSNEHKKVTAIWEFFRSLNTDPPLSGPPLDSLMKTIQDDVKKIQDRGGKVLFVRTPSSGPFWMGEQMGFPRAKYWDRLLALTGCPGIHFADYPAVASFVCPEWSHLKPADAVTWTINLVDILQKEKGWVFPGKTVAQ
ncbi:MAG: hypothetical protein IPP93_03055 [Chitinophagaceae bacterium]|nr:hypothetical protein [Chitinophagaceae bacterium]MBL0334507.1 hypothetical protein [Chitinophagaceae bacterium]